MKKISLGRIILLASIILIISCKSKDSNTTESKNQDSTTSTQPETKGVKQSNWTINSDLIVSPIQRFRKPVRQLEG